MRSCLMIMLFLLSGLADAQIPSTGDFRYQVFDSSDHVVGRYQFTIGKSGDNWKVVSDMDLDTRVYFMKVKLRDENEFIHDGTQFISFRVKYFKDVPFQKTQDLQIEGQRSNKQWLIKGSLGEKTIAEPFDEIRNLISRLIRPEAVLKPGETRTMRSLDPITLTISPVTSRGLSEESIDFQGKNRRLFVMEQKASDGDVLVKKFENGLIYRSQTSVGYALLQSARTTDF